MNKKILPEAEDAKTEISGLKTLKNHMANFINLAVAVIRSLYNLGTYMYIVHVPLPP
jgi:hypothetical protein